jgi:glycosyltransferase involved in cell wall biosynthesis
LKFSVIIPTLNRGERLIRAVRSVLAQTVDDLEVLVVDDGSDDSEALLRANFGDRVRYLRGPAKGVAAGRNTGIDHARGEFVAFLDSDDIWYPSKLERVAEAVQKHPDAGLFYSRMDIVDAEGRFIRTPPIRVKHDVYPAIAEGNFIFNSTVVVRRECLQRAGNYDTQLSGCEDWEMWIRVSRHCRALLIDEPLVAYEYLSAGSFTRRYEPWVRAHDEVIATVLRDDPSLDARRIARIHAGGAYAKASIYLAAGQEALALEQFREAARRNPRHWRARLYALVLSWKSLRTLLPHRVKAAMRLPEA